MARGMHGVWAMLQLHDEPDTNLIELTIDGRVGVREFDEAVARIESKLEQHREVRILEHVRSLGMLPLSRLWDDIKFAVRHRNHVSHAAVVGDSWILQALTRIADPLVAGEIRYFPESSIDEARAWLLQSGAMSADLRDL